jgi:hypothetical protein
MLRIIVLSLVGVAALSCAVQAQTADHNFGLGFVVGDVTGVNGKLWLTESTAVDGSVAWQSGFNDDFLLYADYLFHDKDLIKVDKGILALYFGFGGRLLAENDARLGMRFPVGLTYMIQGTPLDVFVEVAPIMDIIPETKATADFGLGLRFFFGTASQQITQ